MGVSVCLVLTLIDDEVLQRTDDRGDDDGYKVLSMRGCTAVVDQMIPRGAKHAVVPVDAFLAVVDSVACVCKFVGEENGNERGLKVGPYNNNERRNEEEAQGCYSNYNMS